jgi:hypothetical protein
MDRSAAKIQAMGRVYAEAYAAWVNKGATNVQAKEAAREAAEHCMRVVTGWVGV